MGELDSGLQAGVRRGVRPWVGSTPAHSQELVVARSHPGGSLRHGRLGSWSSPGRILEAAYARAGSGAGLRRVASWSLSSPGRSLELVFAGSHPGACLRRVAAWSWSSPGRILEAAYAMDGSGAGLRHSLAWRHHRRLATGRPSSGRARRGRGGRWPSSLPARARAYIEDLDLDLLHAYRKIRILFTRIGRSRSSIRV